MKQNLTKQETLMRAMNLIDDELIQETEGVRNKQYEMPEPFNKKTQWLKRGVAAACLVLAVAGGAAGYHYQQSLIPLSEHSENVTVRYAEGKAMASCSQLIPLTLKEIFSGAFSQDQIIVKATVTDIDNIVINFRGEKEYDAIVKLWVEKVYDGACQKGERLSACAGYCFAEGYERSDAETISNLKEGMKGIFILTKYDDTFTWEMNGAKLALKDIAQYGMGDGVRFAFLETENGLIFDRETHKGAAHAESLDDVEGYIEKMIRTYRK